MSGSLADTTCRIHFDRPASARCPACQQFYCPECITEHDGRLICASCLSRGDEMLDKHQKPKRNSKWWQPMPIIHFAIGLMVVWVIFYLLAQTITAIPDQFHDGAIWDQ